MNHAIINLSLSNLKDATANCVPLFWFSDKKMPANYERPRPVVIRKTYLCIFMYVSWKETARKKTQSTDVLKSREKATISPISMFVHVVTY